MPAAVTPCGLQYVFQPLIGIGQTATMPQQDRAAQGQTVPVNALQGFLQAPALQCLQQAQVQQQQLQQLGPQLQLQQLLQQQLMQLRQQAAEVGKRHSLTQLDVFLGVESLYHDRIRPYGRILRKRLAEHAAARGSEFDLEVKELRSICGSCGWVEITESEGSDWSATIVGRADAFIDVYSPEDVYPDALWREVDAYFSSVTDTDMVLPGGRYSCAQVLRQRRLPFLSTYSLGQICHIVQLCISQKKLLGYLNGTVVPYARSQSMVKDNHAVNQRPLSGGMRPKGVVATWEILRSCVQELVREVRMGGAPIPLSNIKRTFRCRFRTELSETALGYAKVSELLQDPKIADIVEISLRGHGYVMVPRSAAAKKNLISLADTIGVDNFARPTETTSCGVPVPSPVDTLRADNFARAGFSVPVFTQPLSDAAPFQRGVGSLSCNVPDTAAQPLFDTATRHRGVRDTSSKLEAASAASTARVLPMLLGSTQPRSLTSSGEPSKCGPQDVPEADKTTMATSHPTKTIPDKSRCETAAGKPRPPPLSDITQPNFSETKYVKQKPPSLIDDDDTLYGSPVPWLLPPPTPLTLDILSSVHNTFINVTGPPPTPVRVGAKLRARSLPQDAR